MIFKETKLKGSYEIDLNYFNDDRGWFARTYCKKDFSQIKHNEDWVQINHSFTKKKGSIRGLHFQINPHTETKLVRCISGKIFDVIVDIRQNSPTFLNWFGVELSQINKKMLYIPHGFAHGFQTLTDDVELIYHHSSYYVPGSEGGFRYNDPKLDIEWRLDVTNISERDINHNLITKNYNGLSI